MRPWLAVAVFVVPVACGGKVVVDSPGTGATTTGTGAGNGGAGGSGAGGSGAGGGACALTCAEALTDGDTFCSTSSAAAGWYSMLQACAEGACPSECVAFVNGTTSLDADTGCSACIPAQCGGQLASCTNN